MTEDEIRGFDECSTALLRTIPGFLWSFYEELKTQGFSEDQSLTLTKEYLSTLMGRK
jgi:hypothetical protein